MNLCTSLFPCSLSLVGEENGVMKVQSMGSVACYSIHGCTGVSLLNLTYSCESESLNVAFKAQGTVLSIKHSIFCNCSANSDGGLIQSFDGAIIDIQNSFFRNISSAGFGGVISAVGSYISISNSSFANCSSKLGGGALWASMYSCYGSEDVIYTEIHIVSTTFQGCSSKGFGGAVLASGSWTFINVDYSTFSGCQSETMGGALSVTESSTAHLTSTLFENNVAFGSGGGALYSQASNIYATPSISTTTTSFSALNASGCGLFQRNMLFINNSAPSGGGGVIFLKGQGMKQVPCLGSEQICNEIYWGKYNTAKYGPCLATEFSNLWINLIDDVVMPGFDFSISVFKRDSFNQTIMSDSVSVLNIYTSLNSTYQENQNVVIQGTLSVQLHQGQAEFRISLKPTFSIISFDKGITKLQDIPTTFFKGLDYQTNPNLNMISDPIQINTSFGRNVCPTGYILSLESNGLWFRGACKQCDAGTYSLDPLAPNPDVDNEFLDFRKPSCLSCPAGGDCREGKSNVSFAHGHWIVRDGMYILQSCPNGFQLINSAEKSGNIRFSHVMQQCYSCLLGEYIVNPDRNSCQACPLGAQCSLDLSCALRNPPDFECPGGKQVVGTWISNTSTGKYELIDCPAGYSLVREPDIAQQCKPCREGQYIINPDTGICKDCPPGIYLYFESFKSPKHSSFFQQGETALIQQTLSLKSQEAYGSLDLTENLGN